MFEAMGLLIICSGLGVGFTASGGSEAALERKSTQQRVLPNLLFFAICVIMICFCGLRSTMNDTTIYLKNFSKKIEGSLEALATIDWRIGANPIFEIYQILLKTFISDSGHVFLFITAAFVVSSFLIFLRKYSVNFGYSLFVFIGFTIYAFTMAAIKQTIATAIAIWAVPLFIKKKRLRAVLLIAIAMLIHPYVVIFAVAAFLTKGIWDRRTVILLLATTLGVILYGTLIVRVLSLTSAIGDDYDISWFTDISGGNIFRFLTYMVVPVLSFFFRENLREKADPFAFVSVNLCVVSACAIIFTRIGDANLFGRLANYLDVFQCLALAYILKYGIRNKRVSSLIMIASVPAYIYFYYTYYSKYIVDLEWDDCIYNHITIVDLLAGW